MEPERTYRADIDGLRAVSILLVVAFHAGIPAFAGGYVGVDVFFVISGFLITSLLIDEADRTGTVRLGAFYARRARRLLPMAGLTLTTTAIVGWFVVSPLARSSLIADIEAAAFYVANLRFISVAGDYFADASVDQSLTLHHWSLAIEEQFYLVWPLLILVAFRFLRGRRSVTASIGILGGASLLASIATSASLGVGAYFGTQTRIWELAVGAMLAMGRPRLARIPRAIASGGAGAGIVAIGVAALLFDQTTVFPGVAALLPVLGAAAVVAAGIGGTTTAGRLLGVGPMAGLGRISYAWYLWHWPAIVVAGLVAPEAIGTATAIAVVSSFALAWLSHLVVEQPIRLAPRLVALPRRSLALGLTLMLVPVAAGTALSANPDEVVIASASGTLTMTPAQAQKDWRHPGMGECAQGIRGTLIETPCQFGSRNPTAPTVALIGDSHALQWFPALRRAAYRAGWNLHLWTKGGCQFLDANLYEFERRGFPAECRTWQQALQLHLGTLPRLDLIVLGRSGAILGKVRAEDGTVPSAEALPDVLREATARSLLSLRARTPRILIMRDTPNLPIDPNECLARTLDPSACAFDHAFLYPDRNLHRAEVASGVPGVGHLDVTAHLCSTDPCPVVTPDGIIMYRDSHHVTATFAATLSDVFRRRLGAVLEP